MRYDARTVANFLIQRTFDEKKLFTPLQVIKIVYYCQGWSLAVLKRELFYQEIEAWKFGSVVPDVYHKLKHYVDQAVTDTIPGYPPVFDTNEEKIVNGVYRLYGDFGGVSLMRMTHAHDTPWYRIWNNPSRTSDQEVIPIPMIQAHFEEKLRDSNAGRRRL